MPTEGEENMSVEKYIDNSTDQERLDAHLAKFLRDGINEYSTAMARFSVGETWGASIPKDEEDKKVIVEALAHVPIEDENLKKELSEINPKNPTDEQVVLMGEVTMAKAKTLGKEQNKPSLWRNVQEKVADIVVGAIGRKKALSYAGGISMLIAACGGVTPIEPTKIPTQEMTNTPVATETFTPTATKTETPTEVPLFTEKELETANPLDLSTYPERFKKVIENPTDATDKEWADTQAFVEADREEFFKDKGYEAKVNEIKGHVDNEKLLSLWGMIRWVQDNKEEVKSKEIAVVVTPTDIRQMLESRLGKPPIYMWNSFDNNGNYLGGYGLDPLIKFFLGLKNFYYSSDNLGSILGRKDIQTNRIGYRFAKGNLAAVGSMGETKIVILDMRTEKGEHSLFPLVLTEKQIKIPKGSICMARVKGVEPIITVSKDIVIGPMGARGKNVSIGDIFNSLGKQIHFDSGDVNDQLGLDNLHYNNMMCFYPKTNLEMAVGVQFWDVAKEWPWLEK